MRQQLISWLIEDIAPSIRQSKDAEGTILKFAQEQNLAPTLVQGLGQLYNTAKTLAFLEKAGSNRGSSFPILDVDKLVAKYLETGSVKAAGVAQGTIDTWEMDDRDNGGQDLPSCFQGIMTPALKSEEVINTLPAMAKLAASNREATLLALEFQEQFLAEVNMDMEKAAASLAQALRENTDYPFAQLEADALGYFADNPRIQGVMDKIAEYCGNCFPRVPMMDKRASAPTKVALLTDQVGELMKHIEVIDDCFYKRLACAEFKKEATAILEPPAEIPQETMEEWFGSGAQPVRRSESWTESKKVEPSSKPTGDAGGGAKGPRKGGPAGGGSRGGGASDFFGGINEGLDKLLGATGKAALPAIKGMFGGRNADQELMDTGMRDARHIAVLQNLLTTDEILSEAEPDRVVAIYNTIRETAPELAGDVNVMRVLLRSAIQHDGIAPYDLKNILETELAKQKVDWNRRITSDVDYAGAKAQVPNRPM